MVIHLSNGVIFQVQFIALIFLVDVPVVTLFQFHAEYALFGFISTHTYVKNVAVLRPLLCARAL